MTVEEYLLSMVEGVVLPATQKARSPEQRAAAFEARSANHRPTLPCPIAPSAVKRCMKAAIADARSCRYEYSAAQCPANPPSPPASHPRRLDALAAFFRSQNVAEF